jgi:hypothetical protein
LQQAIPSKEVAREYWVSKSPGECGLLELPQYELVSLSKEESETPTGNPMIAELELLPEEALIPEYALILAYEWIPELPFVQEEESNLEVR